MTDDAAARLAEDRLYAHVHEEIRSGKVDTAAQARAMEEGGNDKGLVQQAYIKHRIARIKAEIEIFNQQEEIERKEAERIRQDEDNEQMIYMKLKKKFENEFKDRLNAEIEKNEQMIYMKLKKKLEQEFKDRLDEEIEEKKRANPPKAETSIYKHLTENLIYLGILGFIILFYIFVFIFL